MKHYALVILLVLTRVAGFTMPESGDSSNTVGSRKPPIKVTTRMHSMGLFSYGGRMVSPNHVMDLHVVYKRRTWGFQLFKGFDLKDRHTPINFTLAAVNRAFQLGTNLTITPHVGVVLEQFESFADHGSDAMVILTTAWRCRPRLTLEHTAMMANLVVVPELMDWVNRLRLVYSNGNLDVTLFAWHNNRAFDAIEYSSVGVSFFFSRLPLAGTFTLQSGITGLYMPQASEERILIGANGVFLTLGVSVN
jgi:hypothetical protein